jgi:hypothetical protein
VGAHKLSVKGRNCRHFTVELVGEMDVTGET